MRALKVFILATIGMAILPPSAASAGCATGAHCDTIGNSLLQLKGRMSKIEDKPPPRMPLNEDEEGEYDDEPPLNEDEDEPPPPMPSLNDDEPPLNEDEDEPPPLVPLLNDDEPPLNEDEDEPPPVMPPRNEEERIRRLEAEVKMLKEHMNDDEPPLNEDEDEPPPPMPPRNEDEEGEDLYEDEDHGDLNEMEDNDVYEDVKLVHKVQANPDLEVAESNTHDGQEDVSTEKQKKGNELTEKHVIVLVEEDDDIPSLKGNEPTEQQMMDLVEEDGDIPFGLTTVTTTEQDGEYQPGDEDDLLSVAEDVEEGVYNETEGNNGQPLLQVGQSGSLNASVESSLYREALQKNHLIEQHMRNTMFNPHLREQIKWAAKSLGILELSHEAKVCKRYKMGRQANKRRHSQHEGRRRRGWQNALDKGECPLGWKHAWSRCHKPCRQSYGKDWGDFSLAECYHKCRLGWQRVGGFCHKPCPEADRGNMNKKCDTEFCAVSSNACKDKHAEIGTSVAFMVFDIATLGSGVGSGIKAARLAGKNAIKGAVTRGMAKGARIATLKKGLKSLAKKVKQEFYQEFAKSIIEVAVRGGATAKDHHSFNPLEEILMGAANLLIINQLVVDTQSDNMLIEIGKDALESIDPTGIYGVVRSFEGESCDKFTIDPMPPIPKQYFTRVSCGGHHAANCEVCPIGSDGSWKGKWWCNGECGWAKSINVCCKKKWVTYRKQYRCKTRGGAWGICVSQPITGWLLHCGADGWKLP